MNFDVKGQQILSVDKIPEGGGKGADFEKGKLIFWRNHPVLVHHVPELLLIWGANIEGRPVQSHQQVLRYLLKYMMKDEPNSASFGAICKAVVTASKDEEPVRKTFQKILMKTVGEHDLSKQECHHILNGLDFVEFSREFVQVNIGGTRRVKNPVAGEEKREAVERNLADVYWARETSVDYQEALGHYNSGMIKWNPAAVTLYQFAMLHTRRWTHNKSLRVPHITPMFNYIPRKNGKSQTNYYLFLKGILLLHQAGSMPDQVNALTPEQLEEAVAEFVKSPLCPKIVSEEHWESQSGSSVPPGNLKTVPDDDDGEEMAMKPFGNEEELFVPPLNVPETHEQDQWMEALKPIHDHEQQFYEMETDYDDLDILAAAHLEDWQADRNSLNLTDEQLREMPLWIKMQKKTVSIVSVLSENDSSAPTYSQLNDKQKIAFHILDAHIQEAKTNGLNSLKQLLLNISGGAGTGKSFWLNAVRAHAASQLNQHFVKSAAPSGTAA